MLHITSFVQNIAKLNQKNKCQTTTGNILNRRNYSFIYDHKNKRYDYHYEPEDESVSEGYWGYMRDRNADTKVNEGKRVDLEYDGYWGNFKDVNFVDLNNENDDDGDALGVSPTDSISSLSRFKDIDDIKSMLEYDYNYKTSKVKIQACKRDEAKILMQSLEDQESKFKKETLKTFNNNNNTNLTQINFLHFSNTTAQLPTNNFKQIFNTLTKLKKSINLFNGNIVGLNRSDIFINNVHASMNDTNGFTSNYLNENNSELNKTTTNVSLLSNITDFGHASNYSTMLFEYQNVKIGFMALIDKQKFNNLKKRIDETVKIEYLEYLRECDELSRQLRVCGANLIVVLTDMGVENEMRLVKEGNDLDIVFSCNSGDGVHHDGFGNRWIVRSANKFENLSLVSIKLDCNKVDDVEICNYLSE